jgi:hypothetical protein
MVRHRMVNLRLDQIRIRMSLINLLDSLRQLLLILQKERISILLIPL